MCVVEIDQCPRPATWRLAIDRTPAANFVIPTRPVIKLSRHPLTLSTTSIISFNRVHSPMMVGIMKRKKS